MRWLASPDGASAGVAIGREAVGAAASFVPGAGTLVGCALGGAVGAAGGNPTVDGTSSILAPAVAYPDEAFGRQMQKLHSSIGASEG